MMSWMVEPVLDDELETAASWMDERVRAAGGRSDLKFPRVWVPRTGLGVFTEDGRLLAVAVVYFEQSSGVAVCGFMMANPENTARESYRAVKLLVNAIPTYARDHGAKILMTVYGNRGINRMLDAAGYENGENCESKYRFL